MRFWDAAGKEQKTLTPNLTDALTLAFLGDGKLLALGDATTTCCCWTRRPARNAGGRSHLGWVSCLAYAKGGQTLISGSFDQTLKTWEPTVPAERDVLRLHQGKEVYAVAFRDQDDKDDKVEKGDRYLASAGADGTIKLWNLTLGKEAGTLTGHKGSVLCLAFSPDGKRLASGGADGVVRLWDTTDPKKNWGKETAKWIAHTKAVLCLSFSGNNREGKYKFLAVRGFGQRRERLGVRQLGQAADPGFGVQGRVVERTRGRCAA